MRTAGLLEYLRTSTNWLPEILRYGSVGGLVLCFDFGMYALLLWRGANPVSAVAFAGLASAFIHFFLSKIFTFRDARKKYVRQATTYIVLGVAWWAVTLGIVQLGTAVFHIHPYLAKLVAVVVNFPVGFIANRTLTFGTVLDEMAPMRENRREA